MKNVKEIRQNARPYELFMLILSLFALAAMATNTFNLINDEGQIILEWADIFVCMLFFTDFFISLYRAPKRLRYFFTWGWIDLLSSIPTIDILRWGRVARILRVFRVLRALKAAKIITAFILDRRGESAFLAATLLSILLVTFSSIAILQLETALDSNIKGPGDAVWWSLVTLTTVGYGDRFPVTDAGRIIGVILMVAGVGLFGTLSGFIASWFLSPTQKKEESEIGLLRSEIAELKALVLKVPVRKSSSADDALECFGPGEK
jgi:voltage-gated potassium channel